MGQVASLEACCGTRAMEGLDAPACPSRPISGLGDQYVTFESGQAEAFPMKGGVWRQSLSYEVHDVDGNPWFKLEGRVAPAGNSKRLVLNTGIHHASLERDGASWKMTVKGERRATLAKHTPSGEYRVFIHDFPCPHDNDNVEVAVWPAQLKVVGNPRENEYCFVETETSTNVARVSTFTDTSVVKIPGGKHTASPGSFAKSHSLVQIAPGVDVALVLLSVIAIDSSENDSPDHSTPRSVLKTTNTTSSARGSKTDAGTPSSVLFALPADTSAALPEATSSAGCADGGKRGKESQEMSPCGNEGLNGSRGSHETAPKMNIRRSSPGVQV